jgi:hypothetical protein
MHVLERFDETGVGRQLKEDSQYLASRKPNAAREFFVLNLRFKRNFES